ncbi:hypothetical protein CNY89_27355, partial [Amaricoccus sp. HAR-UPW-R2A-40]
MGFSNVFLYFILTDFLSTICSRLFIAFMTALAISTSSLLTMAIQIFLMLYAFVFRRLTYKWPIFLFAMLIATG